MTLGVNVNEVARVFSFLVPKTAVTPTVTMAGASETIRVPVDGGFRSDAISSATDIPEASATRATSTVPLLRLAWVRNGDKGDISNVAVIARQPEYLPFIAAALKSEAVRAWYQHLLDPETGQVERHYLPGIAALNFLLHGGLDGGCTSSLRFDPLGKSVAQELLDFPVPVSADVARAVTGAE
jgi:hypothetical protein